MNEDKTFTKFETSLSIHLCFVEFFSIFTVIIIIIIKIIGRKQRVLRIA